MYHVQINHAYLRAAGLPLDTLQLPFLQGGKLVHQGNRLSDQLLKANIIVFTDHSSAISHGEGRFVASEKTIDELLSKGQINTQYVDLDGNPTYDIHFNPNGSYYGIECITSPDGRILGKMGHSERIGDNLYKNVIGEYDMKLFESAVDFFK